MRLTVSVFVLAFRLGSRSFSLPTALLGHRASLNLSVSILLLPGSQHASSSTVHRLSTQYTRTGSTRELRTRPTCHQTSSVPVPVVVCFPRGCDGGYRGRNNGGSLCFQRGRCASTMVLLSVEIKIQHHRKGTSTWRTGE